jgi:hypothetical protein
LETGDGVGKFVDVMGVDVRAGAAVCIEWAAIASLDAFPFVALLCVGVCIGPEDTHVIEVLVAVDGGLVVVPSDAVSCVGHGVGVYHTWGGVGVAELGRAAIAPWVAFFVGRGFLKDVWTSWCGRFWSIAASFGGAG